MWLNLFLHLSRYVNLLVPTILCTNSDCSGFAGLQISNKPILSEQKTKQKTLLKGADVLYQNMLQGKYTNVKER